jgi:hypothetical protein
MVISSQQAALDARHDHPDHKFSLLVLLSPDRADIQMEMQMPDSGWLTRPAC